MDWILFGRPALVMALATALRVAGRLARDAACLVALGCVLRYARDVRLHALREYGAVIHEFDPWFHYRVASFLEQRGWAAFKTWFDHKAWAPLGTPTEIWTG